MLVDNAQAGTFEINFFSRIILIHKVAFFAIFWAICADQYKILFRFFRRICVELNDVRRLF